MQNSYELFKYLYGLNLFDMNKNPYWWHIENDTLMIVEVILTQQSRWEKVKQSINNLKKLQLVSLDLIIEVEQWILSNAIVPSGFYNQKASRIKLLFKNIKSEFDTIDNFKKYVTRDWLLQQKGIGKESADSILCYLCKHDIMVVDSYTAKLLKEFDYEFSDYDQMQEWCESGIYDNQDKIKKEYPQLHSINQIFAIFHGLIVEKQKNRTKKLSFDKNIDRSN